MNITPMASLSSATLSAIAQGKEQVAVSVIASIAKEAIRHELSLRGHGNPIEEIECDEDDAESQSVMDTLITL